MKKTILLNAIKGFLHIKDYFSRFSFVVIFSEKMVYDIDKL